MQQRTLKDQFMLRLPDGWRDALKNRAGRNRRSLNSEILAALECILEDQTAGVEIGVTAPAATSNNTALQGGASINNG